MQADLPTEWSTASINDCMDAIIDYRGKTPRKTSFGVPLVTAKIVRNGRIEEPNEFIAPDEYDTWMRRGLPQRGDVVMTTEAPLGEVARLDGRKVALAQRIITLRGKAGMLNNGFLLFAMQSSFVQDQLAARASGTTVMGIKQAELRKVSIPLPPLDEQQAIAKVLCALDDKIELNRQMNATLEGMATALFMRWYAKQSGDGDFPTATELVEAEILVINDGYRAKRSELGSPGLPFVRAGNLQDDGIDLSEADLLSNESVSRAGNKVSQPLDVAFTSKGTVGRMTLVSVESSEFVYSPQVCFWRATNPAMLSPHVLYHWMRSDEFFDQVDRVKGQTDMADYVSLTDQRRMRITLPLGERQRGIRDSLSLLHDRIAANALESKTLSNTRNLLLPLLLSGEIRLRDVEAMVEEVA